MDVKTLTQDEAEGMDSVSDTTVVQQVLSGKLDQFELLMRRYNQRLFRIARGILKNESEAEDVVQDVFVRAYAHLQQFAGESKFSTWLTKIAVHEALARIRMRRRFIETDDIEKLEETMKKSCADGDNPEKELTRREIGAMMEEAIDSLPEKYRLVFILREVEGLSTEETAESLEVGEEAVKSRLFRARGLLRARINERMRGIRSNLFQFAGERCDRTVSRVFERIRRTVQS